MYSKFVYLLFTSNVIEFNTPGPPLVENKNAKRSKYIESTCFSEINEVKQRQTSSILGWVTT